MKYRPDIDGLRAIAVIAVILFHAGLPGFSGGFIGVDVFFVISGFLITQILRSDFEAERISIVKFYERRARRILPALLTVLLLTLAGGYIFLLPEQFADLGKAGAATVIFLSNVKFWRGNGYFEPSAEFQPLLHTWSLAVEEQFYLVFPLFLAFLLGARRRWLTPAIAVIGAGSFIVAAVGVFLAPSATFFLIPTRAWELLIGAALALDLIPRFRSAAMRETAAIGGLAAIVAAVAFYTSATYFPGVSALLPCIGTALLIQAARDEATWVSKALSVRAMVFTGLISYSLYLYHFPVFVFARHWMVGELTLPVTLLCIAVTAVLATLSWRFVERPFRQSGRFNRAQIFTMSALGSAAILALSVLIIAQKGMPQRFDAQSLALAAARTDFDARRRRCINVPLGELAASGDCALGTTPMPPTSRNVILWGDSHAAALAPAIEVALDARKLGGTLASFNACPPILGDIPTPLSWKDRRICVERNRALVSRVRADRSIDYVLLTGFWSAYFEAEGGRHAAALEEGLRATIEALGDKQVIVLLDTPRSRADLPWELALARHFGRPPPRLTSGDTMAIASRLRAAAGDRARLVSTSAPLCEGSICPPIRSGKPILSDANHVSASAATTILGPYLRQRDLFAPKQPAAVRP